MREEKEKERRKIKEFYFFLKLMLANIYDLLLLETEPDFGKFSLWKFAEITIGRSVS